MSNNNWKLIPATIGTPEHFRWVRTIIFMILTLNFLDATLTYLWVSLGLASEANPLLRNLIEESPLLFFLTKFALVTLGVWLLWRNRMRASAVVGIFAAFLVYYWILLYHLSHLSDLV